MSGVFDRIYVIYPRGLRTGGPEALHQLVDTLRSLGQDAYLVPEPGTENRERVADYTKYDAPELSRIEDLSQNAVVAPEVLIPYLRQLKKATPICWWLSIDNSAVFANERRATAIWRSPARQSVQQARFRALAQIEAVKRSVNGEYKFLKSIVHLTQSKYAWSYLLIKLDILSVMVSDYTPLEMLGATTPLPTEKRGQTIAYNPRKAGPLTALVESQYPDATYRPLQGMAHSDVAQTLAESAVYLDLGRQPGKDRLPREAAVLGAVTLVARRGTGAFYEDVPTPWEHKVSPHGSIVQNTIKVLAAVFAELELNSGRQDAYRKIILNERKTFTDEVQLAFVKGQIEGVQSR